MKRIIVGCVVFWFWLLHSALTWAAFSYDSFSCMTGYMVDHSFPEHKEYEIIPIYISFDKDITPWFRKKGWFDWHFVHVNFQLGGFLDPVISPDNNLEFGISMGLMWIFDLTKRLRPYFHVGTGPGYTTQHTVKQATQWDFFSWAAAGMMVSISKDTDFLLEYRIRHFSNGGLKEPNKGINHEGFLFGIRRRF